MIILKHYGYHKHGIKMTHKGYFKWMLNILSLHYDFKNSLYKYYIMSQIKVNGKEQTINESLSLSELLKINNVAEPDMVSIQINGSFILREEYDSTKLNENDEVDFLYFMGGSKLY
jgi:sulfur carrier protein